MNIWLTESYHREIRFCKFLHVSLVDKNTRRVSCNLDHRCWWIEYRWWLTFHLDRRSEFPMPRENWFESLWLIRSRRQTFERACSQRCIRECRRRSNAVRFSSMELSDWRRTDRTRRISPDRWIDPSDRRREVKRPGRPSMSVTRVDTLRSYKSFLARCATNRNNGFYTGSDNAHWTPCTTDESTAELWRSDFHRWSFSSLVLFSFPSDRVHLDVSKENHLARRKSSTSTEWLDREDVTSTNAKPFRVGLVAVCPSSVSEENILQSTDVDWPRRHPQTNRQLKQSNRPQEKKEVSVWASRTHMHSFNGKATEEGRMNRPTDWLGRRQKSEISHQFWQHWCPSITDRWSNWRDRERRGKVKLRKKRHRTKPQRHIQMAERLRL